MMLQQLLQHSSTDGNVAPLAALQKWPTITIKTTWMNIAIVNISLSCCLITCKRWQNAQFGTNRDVIRGARFIWHADAIALVCGRDGPQHSCNLEVRAGINVIQQAG